MELSDPVKATITQFVAKYPMPVGEANLQSWTHQLCEQLAYSYPTEGWCHKASGIGASHSKDTVAINQPGGSFYGWDIIIGAGTPTPALDLNAQSVDLSGQFPEPVTPTNWIGGPTPPPPDDLEARVAALEAAMVALRADVATLQQAARGAASALEIV